MFVFKVNVLEQWVPYRRLPSIHPHSVQTHSVQTHSIQPLQVSPIQFNLIQFCPKPLHNSTTTMAKQHKAGSDTLLQFCQFDREARTVALNWNATRRIPDAVLCARTAAPERRMAVARPGRRAANMLSGCLDRG